MPNLLKHAKLVDADVERTLRIPKYLLNYDHVQPTSSLLLMRSAGLLFWLSPA